MRENRTSGSEGGGTGSNRSFLPLSLGYSCMLARQRWRPVCCIQVAVFILGASRNIG